MANNLPIASFLLDPSSYLGLDYDAYQEKLNGLCLSKPEIFFKYRANVMSYIKKEAVKNIYFIAFFALKYGCKYDPSKAGGKGDPIDADVNATDKLNMQPSVADNTINDLSISLSKTLNVSLDKIVNLIVPDRFAAVAELRSKAYANASGINLPSL